MKCTKCRSEMVIRNGKFGKFLACPRSNPKDNHGTISLSVRPITGIARASTKRGRGVSLMDSIKRESIYLGAPIDDMQDLCEWIVDNPADCFDNFGNETDHWMNTRPY